MQNNQNHQPGSGPVQQTPDPTVQAASQPPRAETPHHPWRRFFASGFDFTLCQLVVVMIINSIYFAHHAYPPDLHAELNFETTEQVMAVMALPIMGSIIACMLIAVLLQHTGTTIGKSIFGIMVTRQDGSLMSYDQALRRELYVWIRGTWIGLPLLCLIPMWLSYNTLTKTGATKWDKSLGLSVHYKPSSTLQSCLNIIGVVFFWIIFSVYKDIAIPLSAYMIIGLLGH